IRGKHDNAVAITAHTPTAPQIAIDITTQSVGRSVLRIDQNPAIGQPEAVINEVIDPDHAWQRTRLNDIDLSFIGREAETVRTIAVVRDNPRLAGRWIEPIDIGWQLGGSHMTLVVAQNPERWICEPD